MGEALQVRLRDERTNSFDETIDARGIRTIAKQRAKFLLNLTLEQARIFLIFGSVRIAARNLTLAAQFLTRFEPQPDLADIALRIRRRKLVIFDHVDAI